MVMRTKRLRPTTISTHYQEDETLDTRAEYDAAVDLLKTSYAFAAEKEARQAREYVKKAPLEGGSSVDDLVGGRRADYLGESAKPAKTPEQVAAENLADAERVVSDKVQLANQRAASVSLADQEAIVAVPGNDEPEFVHQARRDLASGRLNIGQLAQRIERLDQSSTRDDVVNSNLDTDVAAMRVLLLKETARLSARLGTDVQPTIAEGRVGTLELKMVADDNERELQPGQVTEAEYEKMLREAVRADEWTVTHALGDAWENLRQFRNPKRWTEQRIAYKNTWIRNHAATIRVIARKHGLPEDVLAFMAWRELGGDPDRADDAWVFGRWQFDLVLGKDAIWKTSGGDVSIQLRHVAEQLGLDVTSLDINDARQILHKLQSDPIFNLNAVAKHIAGIRDKFWQDQTQKNMTDEVRMRLAMAYGRGDAFLEEKGGPNRVLYHADGTTPRFAALSPIVLEYQRMKRLVNEGVNSP